MEKILIIGSGGREHAFAWKMSKAQNVQIFIAPGNPGTAKLGTNVPLKDNTDAGEIIALCKAHDITIIVFGPEQPLVAGVVNTVNVKLPSVICVGPTKEAARLEGSKAWAKDFMIHNEIPTALYKVFKGDEANLAKQFAQDLLSRNGKCVIKADGLAGGKGVVIIENEKDAFREIDKMFAGKFGTASETIVIEEFLYGTECSVFIFTDGKEFVTFPPARDYKKRFDDDAGLNTGGMGSVCPISGYGFNHAFIRNVEEKIVIPTLQGMVKNNATYKGFLYIGLMEVNGKPHVIEYNCRMGDPETQSEIISWGISGGRFVEYLKSLHSEEKLPSIYSDADGYAATVVLVSAKYPDTNVQKGQVITGIEDAEKIEGVTVFHAGTKINEAGELVVNGGRVLNVTAKGNSLEDALQKAYAAVELISFEGKECRSDIGKEFLRMGPPRK